MIDPISEASSDIIDTSARAGTDVLDTSTAGLFNTALENMSKDALSKEDLALSLGAAVTFLSPGKKLSLLKHPVQSWRAFKTAYPKSATTIGIGTQLGAFPAGQGIYNALTTPSQNYEESIEEQPTDYIYR